MWNDIFHETGWSEGLELVQSRWKRGRWVSRKGFADVYMATDTQNGETVTMSVEQIRNVPNGVQIEKNIFDTHQNTFSRNPPESRFYGIIDNFQVHIATIRGRSLARWLESCGGTFSIQTVLLIAVQAVTRVEQLHSWGYVHGVISADCMHTSPISPETIHLSDYKSSRKFCDENGSHLPCHLSVSGDVQSVETCRRDDLMSLGYTLLKMLRGSLPRYNVDAYSNNCFKELFWVAARKFYTGMPELRRYFERVRGMSFEERPDYDYLRSVFKDSYHGSHLSDAGESFDWMKLEGPEE